MAAGEKRTYQCVRCESFETTEVSPVEVVRQMKQHSEVAHPYWDLETLATGSVTSKSILNGAIRANGNISVLIVARSLLQTLLFVRTAAPTHPSSSKRSVKIMHPGKPGADRK